MRAQSNRIGVYNLNLNLNRIRVWRHAHDSQRAKKQNHKRYI